MSARHDPLDEIIDTLRKSLDRALEERDLALRQLVEVEQQRDLGRDLALRFESELESQRRDLARQLNDEVGRHAAAIRSLAATLERRLAGSDPSQLQLASLMLGTTDAMCDSVRAMVRRVRPEALAFGGLLEGLRSLLDDWRLRAAQSRFELLAQPSDSQAFGLGSSQTESLAYSLAEAAIESAVHRGQAALVLVSVNRSGNLITLQVSDDGRRPSERGFIDGNVFAALRARVQAAGGSAIARAGEGGGVEVLATLPWPGGDPA